MPDLWFVAGLAMGIVVTGFCAVGSFERGARSVGRRAWSAELTARTLVARRRARADAASTSANDAFAMTGSGG